jgi:hypothetical protein
MKTINWKSLVWISAVGAAFMLSGCEGPPTAVPSSYQTYNHKDGSFQIQYPAGWEEENGGKGTLAWAKFTAGNAEISVDTSTVGSLKGNIAQSMGIMAGGPDSASEGRQPVGAVHESEKADYEEKETVKEQTPVPVTTGFGDSRKSEYTGTKALGGARHGYRVTALGRDLRIRVICECPESEWASLKPAFDKVIESVSQGRPE